MNSGSQPVIVLMSGASSSGKSSIARVLQTLLPFPAIYVEADAVFPTLPTGHPRWPADVPTPGVILTFHRSIAAWAEAGFHVIVDGSLPYGNPYLRDECVAILATYDLKIVGISCDLAGLTHREKHRPEERQEGWAARQASDIHDGLQYAAFVDSSERSPENCAREIVSQLALAN